MRKKWLVTALAGATALLESVVGLADLAEALRTMLPIVAASAPEGDFEHGSSLSSEFVP